MVANHPAPQNHRLLGKTNSETACNEDIQQVRTGLRRAARLPHSPKNEEKTRISAGATSHPKFLHIWHYLTYRI